MLTRWKEPAGPGVRIDSGVEEGMVVTGHYDPLLAKVLVVAPDRARAIARARRAVAELETGGVQTTLPFHAWLLEHPAFVDGDLRTDLVDTDWDPRPLREAAERRAAELVAGAWRPAAPTVQGEPAGVTADAWRTTGRREAVRRWQP
jgi:acetyl/propionyl-CoA carboxylase alpha subunit